MNIQNSQPKTENGFTLVEILVAIAIVAVVIVVVFPNLVSIRQNARDTRRKSDLRQIREALELYKSDQSPLLYPDDGFLDAMCNLCWSSDVNCSGSIYMKKVPCDPSDPDNSAYFYSRDDQTKRCR